MMTLRQAIAHQREKGGLPNGGELSVRALGAQFHVPSPVSVSKLLRFMLIDTIIESPPSTMEINLEKWADMFKPAKPEDAPSATFRSDGPVWVISLDNEATETLLVVLSLGTDLLTATIEGKIAGEDNKSLEEVLDRLRAIFGGMLGTIFFALGFATSYIRTMNKLGGNNGVEINGVVGTMGLIITPRVGKFYGDLIEAGRLGVSGRTILDFLVMASTKSPALASALAIPVVASILQAVSSGTPLGWAIAIGVGVAEKIFGPEPDPNAHGAIVAEAQEVSNQQSFLLAQTDEGNKVSLLSWQGMFSAQQGGGQGVYANRPVVGPWETWTLIDNQDGTVSLQTSGGHFLCAEDGGGGVCQANRTTVGDWEKFYLVNLPHGKVALKTYVKGLFVSVKQDS